MDTPRCASAKPDSLPWPKSEHMPNMPANASTGAHLPAGNDIRFHSWDQPAPRTTAHSQRYLDWRLMSASTQLVPARQRVERHTSHRNDDLNCSRSYKYDKS